MHKLLIASLIIVLAVTSALMVLPQTKALPQVRALTLGTAPQSNNVLASGPPDSGGGIVVATGPENAPLVSPFGVGTILVGQAVSNGKIAFVSDRDGNNEIYTMNADGTGATRLTSNPALDANPTWSHDGTKIAFVRGGFGSEQIYVLDADLCHECIGTGPTNLSQSASRNLGPAWSPDGTRILFASSRDGNFELYAINPDGTGVTRLTSNTVSDTEPNCQPVHPFDYSLSNNGPLSASAGGGGMVRCDRTLKAGTARPVILSCSGLPAGVTCGAFTVNPVTPTLAGSTSVLTINVAASVAAGSYSFTVTGSPLGATTTPTTVSLTVTVKDSTSTSVGNVSCNIALGTSSCNASVTATVADTATPSRAPAGTVTFSLTPGSTGGSLSSDTCNLSTDPV